MPEVQEPSATEKKLPESENVTDIDLKDLEQDEAILYAAKRACAVLAEKYPELYSSLQITLFTEEMLKDAESRFIPRERFRDAHFRDASKITLIVSPTEIRESLKNPAFQQIILPLLSSELGFQVERIPEKLLHALTVVFKAFHEFGHHYYSKTQYSVEQQQKFDKQREKHTARVDQRRFNSRKERQRMASNYRNLQDESDADRFAVEHIQSHWENLKVGYDIPDLAEQFPLTLGRRVGRLKAQILRGLLPKIR